MKATSVSKSWLYIPLILMAIFYLLPLYVMLTTGFKSFEEIDLKTMWSLPQGIAFDNYVEAFSKLSPYLWNSFIMVIPAALISSMIGSISCDPLSLPLLGACATIGMRRSSATVSVTHASTSTTPRAAAR